MKKPLIILASLLLLSGCDMKNNSTKTGTGSTEIQSNQNSTEFNILGYSVFKIIYRPSNESISTLKTYSKTGFDEESNLDTYTSFKLCVYDTFFSVYRKKTSLSEYTEVYDRNIYSFYLLK